jgi:hypothetical protein
MGGKGQWRAGRDLEESGRDQSKGRSNYRRRRDGRGEQVGRSDEMEPVFERV